MRSRRSRRSRRSQKLSHTQTSVPCGTLNYLSVQLSNFFPTNAHDELAYITYTHYHTPNFEVSLWDTMNEQYNFSLMYPHNTIKHLLRVCQLTTKKHSGISQTPIIGFHIKTLYILH